MPLDEVEPVPLALLELLLSVGAEVDGDDDEDALDDGAGDDGEVDGEVEPGLVVEDDDDVEGGVEGDGTTVVDDDEVAGGVLDRSLQAATPSVAATARMSMRFMSVPFAGLKAPL